MKVQFDILCNTRQACPDIIKALKELGFFTEEVYGQPAVDIKATIEIASQKQMKEITTKLHNLNQEKISQIIINT